MDEGVRPIDPASRRRWIVNGSIAAIVVGFIFVTSPKGCAGVGGFDSYERGRSGAGPTVVLLHGAGASGDDLIPFAESMIAAEPTLAQYRFLALEGPARFQLGHTWYTGGREGRREVGERLGAAMAELVADGTSRNQIVVVGFSRGAEMAAVLSSTHGPFGGTAILSGPIPGMSPEGVMKLAPAFIAHGRGDNVVGIDAARGLAEQLEVRGASVEYVEFVGGHTIDPSVEAALVGWLRARLETM